MTLGSPVLSVVVPVYNVADYLPTCLDSLLAGDGAEVGAAVEVVAVDDHSPDHSGSILDAYARQDPRVRVTHLATNVGLGRARNAGLERARGRYVWFVDSDDWLPPGTLPAVLDRLRRTDPDVLMLDHVEVGPNGTVRPTGSASLLRSLPAPVPLRQRPDLLRLDLITSACTKVIRRTFLDEIDLRFPPGWYEDCAFTYPLLVAAGRVDALDRVGYCYRRRGDGTITSSVCERHFDVFEQYERVWSRVPEGPDHEVLRAELFRLMIDHLLVIAGNQQRLPPARRREFFERIVHAYHRHLPAGGYSLPAGASRLKHRLVRTDAYPTYAALRLAWRASAGLRRGGSRGMPQPADLVAR